METVDELTEFLRDATAPETRDRLLARGGAWSLMRVDGVLPDGAPNFARNIAIDLAEYGFSVLRAALALHEFGEERELSRTAFESAASAFEALVRNGNPGSTERGFHRTVAASCYHLASYSAIAFSLFADAPAALNASPAEQALSFLILRDLDRLRRTARDWLEDPEHGDASLAEALADREVTPDDAVATILNSVACRALAAFDLALQSGEDELVEEARSLLSQGLAIADAAGNVPLWWILRLARALIGDLWSHSLHRTLPLDPPAGGEERYAELRSLFISTLYTRRVSELELWPSQLEAASRATDLADDLVVALPTSAGKTRVAELTALMTLATGRRVLIVTPLRALSAQTERSFRRTFGPLGFAVSSLYGASGVSEGDQDALRSRPIVIATPEKLDFALRSDPGIIDDVGLIVLDEGHLIGPTEREIRYEILVQRLLRRRDAGGRRIVCLSAILPDGEALDDLTAWIRDDAEGEPVKSRWRPTRQRFGSIAWSGRTARLAFDNSADGPFVGRFLERQAAIRPERSTRPRDVTDLTLMSAWKFAEQGKRSLVFCTQANWVEGYGTRAVALVRRGYLERLVEDEAPLARALEVGSEWLGADHPVVAAMRVGVAIHHGKLPQPFLCEMELLLGSGTLKVIVASPTLSQGLNLNAAVLLVPYLVRAQQTISGEEFANVAGRAGRAFVDVEGYVAHVMFDQHEYRLREWRRLVNRARARDLTSGLFQVVAAAIARLSDQGVFDRDDAFEYLANSRDAWTGGAAHARVAEEDEDGEAQSLEDLVDRLDAIVIGLVEALDADRDDLPRLLDEALNGSLWSRRLARGDEEERAAQRGLIVARAELIWRSTTAETRRGHFAMGVGLESGLALDAIADELGELVDAADLAALLGDAEALGDALVPLAERLLAIPPFVPNAALPADWERTLRRWVSGGTVGELGAEGVRLVEEAFAYRLVWGLEAVRTRRMSAGWDPEPGAGGAAASLETGVPQTMMSMLVRAGLPSREAAMAAVRTGGAQYVDSAEMRGWLASEHVADLSAGAWPTAATAELWRRFRAEATGASTPRRNHEVVRRRVAGRLPPPGTYRVELDPAEQSAWLLSADFRRVARLRMSVRDRREAVWCARVEDGNDRAIVERFGPGHARWRRPA